MAVKISKSGYKGRNLVVSICRRFVCATLVLVTIVIRNVGSFSFCLFDEGAATAAATVVVAFVEENARAFALKRSCDNMRRRLCLG